MIRNTLSTSRLWAALCVLIVLIGHTVITKGANTWDGGGANNNWSTPLNWDDNLVPAFPVPLSFGGAIRLTPGNDLSNLVVNGITFPAGAGAFTLGGNGITLSGATVATLGANVSSTPISNGITNNSTNLQTVTMGLTLAAGVHTFGGGTGGLALNPAAGLVRNPGSTAVFAPGAGGITTSSITNTNGIIGASATVGTDWATVSGSNIVAYAGYTNVAGGGTIASTPTNNVRINSTVANTPVTLAAAGVTDINSLLYSVDSITQAVTVSTGNTLRFGAGGGIFRTGTSNNLLSFGTVGDGAFITAGGADNTAGDLLVNTGGSANTNQTVALNSVITDNGTGAVRLVKTGLAALAIGSANTFTGGLYVADGRVHLNNAAAAGTGPITIVGSGQVFLSQTATYANNFFIAGTGTTESNGNGAIRIDAGTITGTITLIGNARIAHRTGNTHSFIPGQITGNFSLDFGGDNAGNADNGEINISNSANNWKGDTNINETCILQLGASEVIPNGPGFGNLALNTTSTRAPSLDLNGFNETVNGLSTGGGGTAARTVINNAAGTAATFTVGDNNQTSSFGGSINDGAGTIALTKIGTGTLTLSGSNSYSGNTTINGGRLNVSGSLNGAGAIAVNSGGTFAVSGAGTVSAAINVASGGTLTGNGTINSPVTLIAGSALAGGGGATTASLTINGSLDLPASTALNIAPNTSSPTVGGILVPGSLTTSGGANSVTVNISGSTPIGSYVLVDYGSLGGGGFSSFKLGTTPRLIASLVNNTANGSVDLNVTGADFPIWTGALSSEWSTSTLANPKNWVLNSNNATRTDYLEGDAVVFNDTAAGTTVDVSAANVSPGGVTFNNSAKDFILTGGKAIAGNGGLTKSGTGALTISSANTYAGGTVLNAGTLRINNANAIGSGPLQINGGTLDNTSGSVVTLSTNNPQLWAANLTFTGTNDLNLGGGAITLNANPTVNVAAGTLTVGGTIADGTGNSLAKTGNGTLVLGAGTYSGDLNVNAGTVKLNAAGGLGSNVGVTNINGGTVDINGQALNTTEQFNIQGNGVGNQGAIVNNGAGTTGNQLSRVTLAGDAGIGGTGRFDFRANNPMLELAGHTLSKLGTNQVSLVATTIQSTGAPGAIDVVGGAFSIETGSNVDTNTSMGTITFENGTVSGYFSNNGTVNWPMTFKGNNLIGNGSTTVATIASPMTLRGIGVTLVPLSSGVPGGQALPTLNAPLTLNGDIGEAGGSFGLTKLGINTVIFGGNNSFSGGLNLNEGAVQFTTINNLGAGPLNFNGGTLQYALGAGNVDISVRSVTLQAGGGTIDTNGNDVTFANAIGNNGAGGLTKTGAGTLTLSGNNSYTGPTTITGGGTLQLGASDRINNSSNLVIDSSTFATGGFNERLNKLTVKTSATFDMGSGASRLQFENSSTPLWTGTLIINNWDGLPAGGGTDRIFVGADNFSGLSRAELNSIQFSGIGSGAVLLANGELVPNTGALLSTMKLGDFNQDTSVNGADVAVMLAALTDLHAYALSKHLSDGDVIALGDLDADGKVSNADLQGLLNLLKNGGGSIAAVPEPGSAIMLLFGIVLLAAAYRLMRPAVA